MIDNMSSSASVATEKSNKHIWQVNCRMLYDTFTSVECGVGCLTAQWVGKAVERDFYSSTVRLLVGSVAPETEKNYVNDMQVTLPKLNFAFVDDNKDDDEKCAEAMPNAGKFVTKSKYVHDGDVNRLRQLPGFAEVFVTQTVSSELHVFCSVNLPRFPSVFDKAMPCRRLVGQSTEGFGLCCNALKSGEILSSAKDGNIYLWQIMAQTREGNTLNPQSIFSGHEGSANEVAYCYTAPSVFCSVGDDGQLMIWDSRTSALNKPVIGIKAHNVGVNHVEFNKFNAFLVVTGSEDKTARVWDVRNFSDSLCSLQCSSEVRQVCWSKHHELTLATGNTAGQVHIWNIGADNHSEPMFIHSGHDGEIYDLDWHPDIPFLLLSVASDQSVQVWQMGIEYYKHMMPECPLIAYIRP